MLLTINYQLSTISPLSQPFRGDFVILWADIKITLNTAKQNEPINTEHPAEDRQVAIQWSQHGDDVP
jgi:hypothetical protein